MAQGSRTRGCYLAIQPDPRNSSGTRRNDGKTSFWLKFGDGSPAAYRRTNASYGVAENFNAPPGKLEAYVAARNNDGMQAVVRKVDPGKYLEHHLLNIASDPERPLQYQGTEWHELVLFDDRNLQALQTELCGMLNLFPDYNRWTPGSDGDSAEVSRQPAVVQRNNQFEELFSNTLWEDDAGPLPLARLSGQRYNDGV